MDIKKLEKAAKMLNKIKELDTQILEIDKFAMLVANSETKSSFELRVEDLTKGKEDDEKVSFDEDGSLSNGNAGGIFGQYIFRFNSCVEEKTKPKNEKVIKQELSVNVTMAILGALLFEKQELRNGLIKKLNNIGVSIA